VEKTARTDLLKARELYEINALDVPTTTDRDRDRQAQQIKSNGEGAGEEKWRREEGGERESQDAEYGEIGREREDEGRKRGGRGEQCPVCGASCIHPNTKV